MWLKMTPNPALNRTGRLGHHLARVFAAWAPGARLIEGTASGASAINKYYKYEHCIPNKAA